MLARFGPAAIQNLGREVDRRELSTDPLGDRKAIAAVPDSDDRPIDLDAVETDMVADLVHREDDRGAIVGELGVRKSWKRLDRNDVEFRQIEDGLLNRDLSHQRRENANKTLTRA